MASSPVPSSHTSPWAPRHGDSKRRGIDLAGRDPRPNSPIRGPAGRQLYGLNRSVDWRWAAFRPNEYDYKNRPRMKNAARCKFVHSIQELRDLRSENKYPGRGPTADNDNKRALRGAKIASDQYCETHTITRIYYIWFSLIRVSYVVLASHITWGVWRQLPEIKRKKNTISKRLQIHKPQRRKKNKTNHASRKSRSSILNTTSKRSKYISNELIFDKIVLFRRKKSTHYG